MIISPGRRYIFVHIPKTGGTSLALALEERAKKNDIMLGDTPKARKRRGRIKDAVSHGRLWKHSTLADIEGLVDANDIADFFRFTLVRNPWDRLVSYYHWLQKQQFDHPAVTLAKQVDFADFLRDPMMAMSLKKANYAHYMSDSKGVVQNATYIRLEHFAQDAAPLWQHLGFELSLPHENASARNADYTGYYSDELAAHVSDICAADIARFGYRFG